VNELQMLHRFHHGTGAFRVVEAIERWWKMPVQEKESLQARWAAEDAEKKGLADKITKL